LQVIDFDTETLNLLAFKIAINQVQCFGSEEVINDQPKGGLYLGSKIRINPQYTTYCRSCKTLDLYYTYTY